MQTTCAVLIIQDNKLFMCHSTGNNFWDLPKGLKEEHESFIEAAIRETKEETSFEVFHEELELLGLLKYNAKKDIALFKYIGSQIFDHTQANCTSMFENLHGYMLPEADGFTFFTKEEALQNCGKSMFNILKDIEF